MGRVPSLSGVADLRGSLRTDLPSNLFCLGRFLTLKSPGSTSVEAENAVCQKYQDVVLHKVALCPAVCKLFCPTILCATEDTWVALQVCWSETLPVVMIWKSVCTFPYEWIGRNAVPEVLAAGTLKATYRSAIQKNKRLTWPTVIFIRSD